MSNEHTPGPWHFTNDPPTGEQKITVSGPRIRADIGLEISVKSAHLIDMEEMHANAVLIAAAPELLQALEDMVGAFDKGLDLPWGTARAAIAKAKGETP